MSKNTESPVTITEAERRRRQAAADFARASVGLEGFKPSEEAEAQMRRHINGEIDLAELVKSAR
ncbi:MULTISPECIES: antitoxin VbhA family protein [unclassified Acidovorax]|uniref:antitoxin VbhA family protein n=1 Tax=unclassified Acidovorax TaxID=2684926 RepID=UPI002882E7A4|nr:MULTISPECIES: antitoxin VbhA family protein [unclassified Acidovorax]